MNHAAEITALNGRIASLEQQVKQQAEEMAALKRIVVKIGSKTGAIAPEDIPGPEAATNKITTQIARTAAAGIDPIQQLRAALEEQRAMGRVSWDMAIDHVPRELFMAAQRAYSTTIGKSGTGRSSVEGFKEYILGTAPQKEQAAA